MLPLYSFLKRSTAQIFYRLMHLLGADVVYNHADYRLISAKVLRALSQYGEVNLFLRGLLPLVGFKSTCVYYSRKTRIAGKPPLRTSGIQGSVRDAKPALLSRGAIPPDLVHSGPSAPQASVAVGFCVPRCRFPKHRSDPGRRSDFGHL